jgi:hypothetical protein
MSSADSRGCDARQQQHHGRVAQNRIGEFVDRLLADALGETVGEDHLQRFGHPLDRRAVVTGRQRQHQAGVVGDHPVQHPVAAEFEDRQRERLDVVVGLRRGLFEFGGNVGEQSDVLALDDGGDQVVFVGEAPVDGGAADACPPGDIVEGDPVEAVLFELGDGGVEDGFGRRVRPPIRNGHSP